MAIVANRRPVMTLFSGSTCFYSHRTRLVRITGAGLRESHPHDVAVLRDE